MLAGVAIGVAVPLVLFRWFTPNEVFPISYRRGLEEQLGLVATEVKPFGLAGSAGSTPLRITVEGDPPSVLFGKLHAQSRLRSDRW